MWGSLLGGLMGSGAASGMGTGMTNLMGAPAGSAAEMAAFDTAPFENISAEGITGSMSGNTKGPTAGNMVGMMGGGGKGGGGYGKMAYQQGLSSGPGGANDMSRYAQIQPLMSMAMAGSGQQEYKPLSQPNINPYVRGLMGV